MRFVALLPLRDEADIIDQSLVHLLDWADSVYVFDTGSVDDTWEKVLDLARREPRIKPLTKEPVYFSETRLRGYLFDVARRELRDGDWFARVDADEFHHIGPAEFVRSRLARSETCVYHQYYNFQLTRSEAAAWERGEETLTDRRRPIAERRRFYLPSVYSEPRLCRYRRSMQWPITASFPVNAGFVARERIPIRHYPHRDPAQMERRCRLRAVMMADPTNRRNWGRPDRHHWSRGDWREQVVADDAPGLYQWAPGTELPLVYWTNHLRPWHVRQAQRLVHASCLPLLDRLRRPFPRDARPQPITVQVQQQLVESLGGLP
jgi:glycosyltransferase involved in cell wall biosynthesis